MATDRAGYTTDVIATANGVYPPNGVYCALDTPPPRDIYPPAGVSYKLEGYPMGGVSYGLDTGGMSAANVTKNYDYDIQYLFRGLSNLGKPSH